MNFNKIANHAMASGFDLYLSTKNTEIYTCTDQDNDYFMEVLEIDYNEKTFTQYSQYKGTTPKFKVCEK